MASAIQGDDKVASAWIGDGATAEALLPKLISVGPSSWRADPEELIRCLEAFRRGLAVPAGRQQGAGTEQKTPE